MKRYSSLIRKLVDATAEAEDKGEDITELLKTRCFNDSDIVRQTLMNAVCDPRFRLYASMVGYWRDEARNSLEALADELTKTQDLDRASAHYMLEDFIHAWLHMTFKDVQLPERKILPYFTIPEDKHGCLDSDVDEFFENVEPAETDNNDEDELEGEEDYEPDDALEFFRKRNPRQKDEEDEKNDPKNKRNVDSPTHKSKNKAQLRKSSRQYKPQGTTGYTQLANDYLSRIPMSLVELARRIGRMGEIGNYKTGRFLSASKTDISGITIGNDLHAVMPSELAILAEKKTQHIFYSNYSARRLQLFASKSESKSSKKHEDGPVIVCVDTSSSMGGEPLRVARSLALAVAVIAWRKKRDVIMVKYSDQYDYLNLGHNQDRIDELKSFLSFVNSGGNNENSMFRWLFEHIRPSYPDYANADILCISDFGWTPLTTETESLIDKEKKKGMRFYGLNVLDRYNKNVRSGNENKDIPAPMAILDSVWNYRDGECYEVLRD